MESEGTSWEVCFTKFSVLGNPLWVLFNSISTKQKKRKRVNLRTTRYLSADKVGLLSARREAISPEETFTFIPAPDNPSGCFGLQTARETYVAIESPSPTAAAGVAAAPSISTNHASASPPTSTTLRADAESITFPSTLRIRMQARFKPRLRANKAERAREKISRKELEALVGRRLEDGEVRTLKRARREGDFHERVLDAKVKGKHDRFA